LNLNLIIMATTGTMRYSKNYTNDTNYKTNLLNSRNVNYSSGSNYIFKERFGKLRWKDIINLDIDSMIRNNDLSPLEPYLENLIFCTVDEEDLQIVPEQSVLKLIKTLQHILEEFLRTQMRLESDNRHLESAYSQILADLQLKENILKENKSTIRALKKEKRNQEVVINSYKCALGDRKEEKIYYFCKQCSGKRFSSENQLYEHNMRRHQGDVSRVSNKTNIDEKLDMMKTHFETYIKSFQDESYMRIFENQKHLESRLNEFKKEKKNEINDIENNFRSTIVDLKDMMKNSLFGFQSKTNESGFNKQYDDTMSILKQQAKQMNEILIEMQRVQNEKIQSVAEQFVTFKQEIAEEFGMQKKKDKKVKKVKNNSEDVEPGFRKIESNRTDSIEIIEKPKKKARFNAGAVESDLSEEEIRVITPNKRKNDTIHDISIPETNPTEMNDARTDFHDSPFITKNNKDESFIKKESKIVPEEKSEYELSVSQESILIQSEEPKIVKVGKRQVDKKLEELAILFDNYALRDYEFYDGKPEYTTKMYHPLI
jgi:hypothetical protein